MELLQVQSTGVMSAVLVALANGDIRIYQDKTLIHTIQTNEPVAALRFGRYARMDNALAIVARSGALSLKTLSRTANLKGAAGMDHGPIPEQDVPLPIPKKTQLYIDQSQRERDQATDMHKIFQVRERSHLSPPAHACSCVCVPRPPSPVARP